MRRLRYGALGLVVIGVTLLAILGVFAFNRARQPTARGLLTQVEARDIGHAAAITLSSNDGRQLHFQVDPAVDMTPGHMREHMTYGQPVTVYYRREGNALVAVNVTD